jgi:hypothetical protein
VYPWTALGIGLLSAETDTATTSSSKQEVFVSSREETWRDFSDTDLALVEMEITEILLIRMNLTLVQLELQFPY